MPAAGLDRDAVVGAALDIAAEGGFAAMSMRVLAERLSVTPMAIYRYVANGRHSTGSSPTRRASSSSHVWTPTPSGIATPANGRAHSAADFAASPAWPPG